MITVHGVLGAPSPELRKAAGTADWVVGGRRHLDALEVEVERRITLGALRQAVETIATLPETDQIVVIASGDPLYFGVVRTLRRAGLRPRVVTAPSSIAAAFAAVGVPWDDAAVVSVHGRPLAAAVNLARAHPKVAVFTSAENGLRELAAGLADLGRRYVLAERLGEDDERVRVFDGAQAMAVEPVEPVEPNVVLILDQGVDAPDSDWPGAVAGPLRGPRPSVSAAAAVAFARLLPEPGELLWASGPLAEDVAALARWSGAAVWTPEGSTNADTPAPATPATPVSPFTLATPTTPAAPATPDTPLSPFTPETPTTPPAPAAPATPAAPIPATGLVTTASLAALAAHAPRAIVLTGEPPAVLPSGFRWTSEHIGDHLLTTGVHE